MTLPQIQDWCAVVVAAGRGTRFGRPKQLLELAGRPMVAWSIATFSAMPEVRDVVVVTEPESIEPMREVLSQYANGRTVRMVAGGATRQASVFNGVRMVPDRCDGVFVHDGARPLVRAQDVRAGMAEVRDGRASLLAAPVVDTIKVVNTKSKVVAETLDRGVLWAAQTPQFALTADLAWAHERAREEGIEATDDAALLERLGIEVTVVASSVENFKVTLPEDLIRARAILEARAAAAAR